MFIIIIIISITFIIIIIKSSSSSSSSSISSSSSSSSSSSIINPYSSRSDNKPYILQSTFYIMNPTFYSPIQYQPLQSSSDNTYIYIYICRERERYMNSLYKCCRLASPPNRQARQPRLDAVHLGDGVVGLTELASLIVVFVFYIFPVM